MNTIIAIAKSIIEDIMSFFKGIKNFIATDDFS